jgi:hypothetical protein
MTWQIRSEFSGYQNKRDKTNLPPGVLIAGSKNVVSTDGDLVGIRQGYTLLGAANSDLYPIESNYEWICNIAGSNGGKVYLRSYDDELEFLYGSTWYKLQDGWSAVDFNYTSFYDTTEKQDLILFVNGDSNIYDWSGGYTKTFASVTANTITKSGTLTWAEERFLTAGTRKAKVQDDAGVWWEFEYTGGETTTTLTGVTVDLTGKTITAGNMIVQSVRTNTNEPDASLQNDLIATLNNQVYVGSLIANQVYVSKVDDFKTYTFSSPRLVGEGALFTLDAAPKAFIPQEDTMYISAGRDYWYQVTLTLSSDIQNEAMEIKRLKTSTDQGAINQGVVTSAKNYVAFISHEPTFDFLGRLESLDNPQALPLSDSIKLDFDLYDFTGANCKFYKNNLYIAIPVDSILRVYNMQKGFWEAPWVLPAGRLAIIDENLCLHSNSVPETYKLFDGYNDNTNAVEAIARFSYENYGDRANKKTSDEWYTEMYIGGATKVMKKLYFEYQGAERLETDFMEGSDEYAIIDATGSGFGKENLGKQKLAGDAPTDDMKKYRKIKTFTPQEFYEMVVEYSSNDIDQRWDILATGGNIEASENTQYDIRD